VSVEDIGIVLNHSRAEGRTKLVLIGIANHLGDHGAWPSIATLARYANASERSVKRDIKWLEEAGELFVERNASPMGGQYKTNLYWILLHNTSIP
jgi:predicted DNA-binding transcriptional regulator YafY